MANKFTLERHPSGQILSRQPWQSVSTNSANPGSSVWHRRLVFALFKMVDLKPGDANVAEEIVWHVSQALKALPPLPPAEEPSHGALHATFIIRPEQRPIPNPSQISDHFVLVSMEHFQPSSPVAPVN
jgi:hypothetical protein